MTDTAQSPTSWEGLQVDEQVFDVHIYYKQEELKGKPNFYCFVDSNTSTMIACWFEPSAFPSTPERSGNGKVDEV